MKFLRSLLILIEISGGLLILVSGCSRESDIDQFFRKHSTTFKDSLADICSECLKHRSNYFGPTPSLRDIGVISIMVYSDQIIFEIPSHQFGCRRAIRYHPTNHPIVCEGIDPFLLDTTIPHSVRELEPDWEYIVYG